MRRARPMCRLLAAGLLLALAAKPAAAVNVIIDYTYDSNNFFGAGNPSGAPAGAQAKAALEAAASYFSTILNDTFSEIVTPPLYHSSVFSGQMQWQWTANITHPGNGSSVVLTNPTIAADEYRIYAGARSLSGTTAGQGGPGGYGWSATPSGDGFTSQEIDEIEAITEDFRSQVEDREESSGFAAWGGVITFDRDASTTWHYNHTSAPSGGATDFYSVVIHELTHAFGFGSSSDFQAFVSGSNFIGANAVAKHGGPVPLSGNAHWAYDTMSTVYGTATVQEAAMDPDVLNGTRKLLTELDAAALKDIGWELVAPPVSPTGDYNGNGTVDAADYVAWRNTNGQNVMPGSGADGSGNGTVGPEDYTFWRSRFGMAAAGGSASFAQGAAVPEPAHAVLALIGSATGFVVRRSPRLGRGAHR